ncbi:scabin-related ADP-ribosyltransferase [Amycolatopsis cihanbeyliensis]|uniref:scabin-related ADP-ribosyltransferase n=1 Tax=Amycolatopsis cihanbeyliensis TaxID=1128664 RepID=UPI001477793F|nr:LamG-like jellyroll fold domain-containing protein [Amycolatopsis cihanbeyliensis]
MLLGLVFALVAGLLGPGVRYIGPRPDAEDRLEAAMEQAPDQEWGSATTSSPGEAGGEPNRATARSLQSKYPEIKGGGAADRGNEVRVEQRPESVRGFDEGTSRELPGLRTEHERTYRNDDGTYTTEFGREALNYRDEHGDYQPIDPTLTPLPGARGWRNSGDNVRLEFARSADAPTLASAWLDERHEFGFALAGASGVTGEVDGATVTYRGVRRDADLRIDSLAGGFKETIVLSSPDAPHAWTFPLRLKGLTPSVVDGSVVLKDSTGRERARIPAGFMTDAKRDPQTGDFTTSHGVTYRLVEHGGQPALRVELDSAWLRDPARQYPVEVDPSLDTSQANHSMYVQNGNRFDGGTQLKVGTTGSLRTASYLAFDGIQDRLRNHKIFGAQLGLTNMWSWSCRPRPVTVHGVTSPWGSSGGYPGPAVGSALARESFARGYIGLHQHASSCPTATETINLGRGGRDLVQRWVTGAQPNYGLSVRASATDRFGWKKFAGHRTANPPRLFVTHSAYDARYRVDRGVPEPPVTRTQGGKVKITVTNRGAHTWTREDFALGYRAFTAKGRPVESTEAASLPHDVPRGGSVTLEALIKPLDPGDYLLDFSMLRRGGPWFTDEQIPPTRLVMTVFDVPPIVKAQYPPNGYSAPTLTPQLWVDAVDVDAPVDTDLRYRFEICRDYEEQPDGSLRGISCTDSGYVDKRTWTVPEGALRWSEDYQWRAFAYDGNSESQKLPPSHILTAVPQPEITAHLANAPYSGLKKDFDPQTGNYFSSAIDASVSTTGPELTVARTYNSLDPRKKLLFGAGWSTRYDMRVYPDEDGSGNVVVTYPDGQQVRFGRNHDGTFSAPPGRQVDFHAKLPEEGGGWVMVDKKSTRYEFRYDGVLMTVRDKAGHMVELDYNPLDKLRRAISRTSDRVLYFDWSGDHISSVKTDPVEGEQLTWTYGYEGDRLTKVCDPLGGCTNYEYTSGSHYRSSVIDSRPASYWRLGEAEGSTANSQIGVKLGEDNGTYENVTLGKPGALADSADSAVEFDGNSSAITVPDGTVRKNRDLSIELWFKTTEGGPLFGYQRAPIDETPSGAVPALYVGNDGKLRGQFWNGTVDMITSAEPVNDDQWHHVVLSGSLATQTMYLDGQKVGTAEGEIDHDDLTYNQIGAAYTVPPSSWPEWGSQPRRHFSGQIDEVAFYEYPLGATAARAHFEARASADYLTKVTLPSGRVAAEMSYDTEADRLREYTDRNGGHWELGRSRVTGTENNLVRTTTVTDPGGRKHIYDYDPIRGRILRYIAPLGLGLRPEDRRSDDDLPAPPEIPGCDDLPPPTDDGDPEHCGGPSNGGSDWVGGPVLGQGVRTYDYDEEGFQTTIGDELGNEVVLTNDERGNVLSRKTCRVRPDNCQTTYYEYYVDENDVTDPRNDKLLAARDPRSSGPDDDTYATKHRYTGTGVRGLLRTTTTPDGAVVRHTYTTRKDAAVDGGSTPEGLPATTTDERGGVTSYRYYNNGDLASVENPAGLRTTYTYDVLGRKITETQHSEAHPDGLTTRFEYDELSRPISVTAPPVTDAVTGDTHTGQTVTSYDADGNETRVETRDLTGGDPSRVTAKGYDEHGRVDEVTDAEGGKTFYGYDGFGNRTWKVDPNGNKYEYGYTARNAIAEVRLRGWHGEPLDPAESGGGDGEGNAEAGESLVLASFGYDLAGRKVRETDAMGRTLRYHHYEDDKVRKVVAKKVNDPFDPEAPIRDVTLSEFSYDAAGRLTRETDAAGLVTEYEYDKLGRRIAEIQDPGGLAQRTELTYAPGGDVTKVVHSGQSSNSTRLDRGRVEITEYGYDRAGRTTSETVHNGSRKLVTAHTYDERGLRTSSTDPRGSTTDFGYDSVGQPTTVTQPDVEVETGGGEPEQVRPRMVTGYNTFGEATAQRDENGHVSTVRYDGLGRAVEVSSPEYRRPGADSAARAVTRTEYDAAGNPITVTDPRGAVTRYRYDQLGRMVERTDPRADAGDEPGGVWRYAYTHTGEPLSVTDPTGARTEATYDDLGRQVTATELERWPEAAAYTARMHYDDAGNLTSVVSPTGATTRHDYDVLGQRTKSTDPAGVVTRYGYDLAGQQVRVSDGHGRTTYRSFDQAGRNTGVYQLDAAERVLRKTSFGYDKAGNRVSVTDPYARVAEFQYDSHNRLVRQEELVSGEDKIVTGFGYDAAGNLTRSTDGRGNETVQTYNVLGLPESVIEPPTEAHPAAGDRTWTLGYDLAGNPVTEQAPGDVTRQRTYDALGRLVRETGTGAQEPTAERTQRFDAAGRLLAVSAPGGEKTFGYNDRGALLTSEGPVSGKSEYSYDAAGRLTRRVDAAGTSAFTYNQGRLAGATDGITGVTQGYSYDDAGALAAVDYGGGRLREYGYDDFGRRISDTLRGSGGSVLAATEYGYDLADRITSKKTTGTAGAGENTYSYDHAGRMTSWTRDGTTTDYEWDASGNRTRAGDRAATFDERNRQLTDGDTPLTWTARGTLASRGETQYGFDAFDRAVRRGSVSYEYDGLDRMSARNDQSFGYDGASLNLVSTGTSVFARGADGGLLAQSAGGSGQLAITDLHQDVVAGLDPAGDELAGSAAYDPFGQPLASDGTRSALGYQSDYTDPASGEVDMGARWYTPGTGTFTARDSIDLPRTPSNAANRYTYALGSPTNYTDPDGRTPLAVCVAAPTACAAAGATAVRLAGAGVRFAIGLISRLAGSSGRDEPAPPPQPQPQPVPTLSPGSLSFALRITFAIQAMVRSGLNIRDAIDQAGEQYGEGQVQAALSNPSVGAPPPPPPGIKARKDARQKAINVALPIPEQAKKLIYTNGIVSASPSTPADTVVDVVDKVQDLSGVYGRIKETVLDASKPVINNVAGKPISELAPTQFQQMGGFQGGLRRQRVDGSWYRTSAIWRLNPGSVSDELDARNITPQGYRWRTDSHLLYRLERSSAENDRGPGVIFEQGFRSLDMGGQHDVPSYVADNQKSPFVSTTYRDDMYKEWSKSTHMYIVDAPGGIHVNDTIGSKHQYASQQEVIFPGGIASRYIVGVRRIDRESGTLGPVVRNPYYRPWR